MYFDFLCFCVIKMGIVFFSVVVVVSRSFKYSTYVGKTSSGSCLRSMWYFVCVLLFGKVLSVNFCFVCVFVYGGNGVGYDIGVVMLGVVRRRVFADFGAGGADGVG